MAKQNLYTVYDLEAEQTMGAIMPYPRDAAAVRMFTNLLANKELITGQYPEQFTLQRLGELDTESAVIIACAPTLVLSGRMWLAEQRKAYETPTIKGISPEEAEANLARQALLNAVARQDSRTESAADFANALRRS